MHYTSEWLQNTKLEYYKTLLDKIEISASSSADEDVVVEEENCEDFVEESEELAV